MTYFKSYMKINMLDIYKEKQIWAETISEKKKSRSKDTQKTREDKRWEIDRRTRREKGKFNKN